MPRHGERRPRLTADQKMALHRVFGERFGRGPWSYRQMAEDVGVAYHQARRYLLTSPVPQWIAKISMMEEFEDEHARIRVLLESKVREAEDKLTRTETSARPAGVVGATCTRSAAARTRNRRQRR